MTNLDFKLLIDKIGLEEHRHQFENIQVGTYFIDHFRTELNKGDYYLVIDFLVSGVVDGYDFKRFVEIEYICLLKNKVEEPIKDCQHKQLINKLEKLIKEL